ncbi:MAG: hypothetical protein F4Z75_01355 [Synechococcus sp. SB0668_bin_15]|nr:hypothetical protein [Synechococcus sp. SB0668_bin_15]MYA90571.1 hypothetical protein [Synechococcus sp. SB0663_bin_10]MYC50419.1 hypothetical protein [Synechococcus sp. SB0662_bin_14]MYG47372.1 hypothetical protein [Synechococcus sp. SB0675_bin_6]MYJ59709.1 hypothetical protein [Synechococcus sp. SB0672_bin_6]MYK91243.1 hypothetical protein [Synechococcus sp. SB0669_bin_8]
MGQGKCLKMLLENRFSPCGRGKSQPWPPSFSCWITIIAAHPEQLQPLLTTDLKAHLEDLVGSIDVDLNSPLEPDDEEEEDCEIL